MKKKNNTNKLRMLVNLFKHDFNGKSMTYLFIIDENNEIKRSRVPIKNGLPHIQENLKWEHFSHT